MIAEHENKFEESYYVLSHRTIEGANKRSEFSTSESIYARDSLHYFGLVCRYCQVNNERNRNDGHIIKSQTVCYRNYHDSWGLSIILRNRNDLVSI